MKILHVESGRNLYGGARQVAYLTEGLAERGVENVVAAPEGSAILEALTTDRVRPAPMRMGGDLDLGLVRRLEGLIRAEAPDLIHLHSRRGADVYGGIAGRRAGIPVVLSRRVDNPQTRLGIATKYRLFDRVIAISEAIRDVLLGQGLSPEKVVCIRSSVKLDPVVPREDGVRLLRGLAGSAVVGAPDSPRAFVGMMAQFIERKGHGLLLDALPAVLERHPEAVFLLLGKGPLAGEIQARVETMGFQGSVRLLGFRDDLPLLRSGLDLVVHPATAEGLGVAVLEAAGSGLPVVAGAHGGLPEIVEDGVTGFLVEPTDPVALAGAINQLLAEPGLRARMGGAGRQRVQDLFSVERMVAGHIALYRELVAPGS